MPEKSPNRRLVWFTAAVLMLLAVGYGLFMIGSGVFRELAARDEQAMREFMNPDAAAVREEFEYFTGRSLPGAARVVLARRSRPSPLLGDYSGCALIILDAAELRALLRSLPSGEDASKWSLSCPDSDAFWRAAADRQIRMNRLVRKENDEFILIATLNDRTLLANWIVH